MKGSFGYRGFIHGAALTVGSWIFFFVGIILNPKLRLRYNQKNSIVFFFFGFFSFISFLITQNPAVLLQIVAFYFFLNVSVNSGGFNLMSKLTLVKYLRAYLSIGAVVGLIVWYFKSHKTGLYGVEVNFTGFIILVYLYIIISVGSLKVIDLSFWVSFIFITESRSYLIMSVLFVFLYFIRRKRLFLYVVLSISIVSLFYVETLLDYLSFIVFFQQTGHIDDVSRLYQFYDSSTVSRIDIFKDYIGHFKNDIVGLLFGNSKTIFENNFMEPHNSLIQKVYDYGLISSLFLIYLMKRNIEFWFFTFLIIYSLFLHNLLSIPLLIFISLYGKETINSSPNI
jgi:hypothetical protein